MNGEKQVISLKSWKLVTRMPAAMLFTHVSVMTEKLSSKARQRNMDESKPFHLPCQPERPNSHKKDDETRGRGLPLGRTARGRGYIHTHPAECCTNMALDQIVFEEAWRAGIERVCFASSACVYPNYLQEQAGSSYLLKEEDADPFVRDEAFADLEYGWAKPQASFGFLARNSMSTALRNPTATVSPE